MKKNMLMKTMCGVFAGAIIMCVPVFADDNQDQFIKDLQEGLEARWSYDVDETTLTNSEFIEYREALVNEEYSRLEKYKETEFDSAKFSLMASAYVNALETQLEALDYYSELATIYDLEWGTGYNMRAYLIINFVDSYGLEIDEDMEQDFRSASDSIYSYSVTTEITDSMDETAEETTEESDRTSSTVDIEVFNNEGITVKVTGFEKTDYGYSDLKFKVENLNHKDIIVTTKDYNLIVNGSVLNTSLYQEVTSGKSAAGTVSIFDTELEAVGIDTINNLSFVVSILEADTYNTLYNGDEVYLAVDENGNIGTHTVYTDKDHIKQVQELLNKAGYDCGSADGVPGKNTNNQILQFKKDHGLEESTDITPELIDALENVEN